MKKLKMIVSSVIVLAIVGSAFTFKAKGGAYCVLAAGTAGDVCTTFIQDKKVVTEGGTQFKYAPFWDGDKAACTTTTNHLCTGTAIRFNDN